MALGLADSRSVTGGRDGRLIGRRREVGGRGGLQGMMIRAWWMLARRRPRDTVQVEASSRPSPGTADTMFSGIELLGGRMRWP